MRDPAAKRTAFVAARNEHEMSERRVCGSVSLPGMAVRYGPIRGASAARLREGLLALTSERRRFVYWSQHWTAPGFVDIYRASPMATRDAVGPLRRSRTGARADNLAPTYTITRDTTKRR